MKNFYTILLLLFGISVSMAQTGGIAGKVTDQRNKPLPNVNIALTKTSLGSTTDTNGNYHIQHIAPGNIIHRCFLDSLGPDRFFGSL